MRLVFASDTHSLHQMLHVPDGDVFIHCGDFSGKGDAKDVSRFGRWLTQLPHKRKVVVAGNHDLALESRPEAAALLGAGVDYLFDSGVLIGNVKFWGSPWQPRFNNWAFNLDRGEPLREKWALIPKDLDVLVTHGPPLGILDLNAEGRPIGDADLADRVLAVRPLVHAFGHIHECGGRVISRVGTIFANASILDGSYAFAHPCRVIDILEAWRGKLKAQVVRDPAMPEQEGSPFDDDGS